MMKKKVELVFIPFPATGHFVPTIQLAKLLLDLNPNLSITVLTIKGPHDGKLTAYIDSLSTTTATTARINFINLPPSDLDMDAFKFFTTICQTQGSLVKEAVTNMVELSNSVPDSPRLAGFVLDMFLTPFKELADEFGVPSYAFFTSGAAYLGFNFYSTQVLHDGHKVDFIALKDSDTEFDVPTFVNPVSPKFFPDGMFNPEAFSFLENITNGLRGMKGIMVNTFSELESHAIGALSHHGKLQNPHVYPVGPILNLEGSIGGHQQNHGTIMQWLDEQPRSSVVFLCFGSMGSFDADQVKEIAYALEQSGHRFLWSIRRPEEQIKGQMPRLTDYENVEEVLPEGFLDRTVGIGKVVGWTPQMAILNHPATGGFVSHCGWNSILESIWSGVPMATWPLYAEQQMNAFLLVKELGLAVEIKMDYRKFVDEVEIIKANKIEGGIRLLMEQKSDVRDRMKEMSDKSKKALMDGGSSYSTLRRFIDDVVDNMP